MNINLVRKIWVPVTLCSLSFSTMAGVERVSARGNLVSVESTGIKEGVYTPPSEEISCAEGLSTAHSTASNDEERSLITFQKVKDSL